MKSEFESARNNKSKKIFWQDCEIKVFESLKSVSEQSSEKWPVIHYGGHNFPDVVAQKAFGIEVKTICKKGNSWKVKGGSIMETTRIDGVKRIFVFCVKQDPFDIICRPFEDCVEDVKVTHSPRYMLDMKLEKDESLFKKIGEPKASNLETYDKIRNKPKKFAAFKAHMVESRRNRINQNDEDSELWWYSPNDDDYDLKEERFSSSLISESIEHFNKLNPKDKDVLKVEMLLRFPEIIDSKYENACLWLLRTKGILCHSFRDLYSSKGRARILTNINEWKDEIANAIKNKKYPIDFQKWKKEVWSSPKFGDKEKPKIKFSRVDKENFRETLKYIDRKIKSVD